MPTPGDVTLAMTVHDPDGRLYDLTAAHQPALNALYVGVVAVYSHSTAPATLELLRRQGVALYPQEEAADIGRLGRVRLATVAAGLALGCDHCQLGDHDRMLHWMMTYPDELARAVREVAAHDFLVLGRTDRAFATHPPAQQETERLATHAYALATGQEWDITAGSRGVSRRAYEALRRHSREPSVATDGEWPLVIGHLPGLRLGYLAVEGLEFETADRYAAEIAALGGREAWMRAHYDTLPSWSFRLDLAYRTVEAIRRASDPAYLRDVHE
ncbi:MAG: hypothetical protein GXY76_11740 [Chloroflexi bacterium]|nr:hypothetical protein [Chloroflexota bacterium]